MHKEIFALVDQMHQYTKTSLQSFRRQQLNLTTNFFPRPAVPNPLANANLNCRPTSPNTHLSNISFRFLPALSLQIKIYGIFEDPNTPINSSSTETAQNLVKSPSKVAYLYTSKDSTLNGCVGLLPES